MRPTIISGIIFLFYLPCVAQKINFHGTISNEQGKRLVFAVLWINDAHTGTASNEQGVFQLNLTPGTYTVSFRQTGFETLVKTLTINDKQAYDIRLKPVSADLNGSVANSIIRQVIARRRAHSRRQGGYTGLMYCKQMQELDNGPKAFLKKDISSVLNLDTGRRGIISLSESISQFHTRSTDYIREDVNAAKMTNDSNVFKFNSAAELHIDLYKNTMVLPGLTDHGLLSPIAENARGFYRYQLTGTFYDEGKLIYVISVHPKHRNEHLYKGTICIIDRQWILYSAELHLGHDAHTDFVDSVNIKQQFVMTADSNWVNQFTTFRFYGKLLGFKYSGYFLQLYQDISIDTTTTGNGKRVFYSTRDDYRKDDAYWTQNRPLQLLPQEDRFYHAVALAQRHKKDKTLSDSLQNSNNHFKFIPYFFNGYTLHNYGSNSLWTFPAPTNMAFYNTVEGLGIDLFAKYKKVYGNQHSLTIVPNARYGFSDHVLNTNVFANYIYNPFSQGSVYGRLGSDFLDLNDKGTISPFINSLSTLLLGNNYIKLYQSKFIMAGTTREVVNGVLLNGQIEYDERHPLFNTTNHTFNKDSIKLTSNNPLDPNGDMPLFPAYRALIFQGSATFTFDQEYKINPSGKYILPNPYPRVRFNYRVGIPELGSDVNYDFVSVDVFQDRLNMGIYGFTEYFVSTGRFLNTRSLYYPDYNQFSGGQSFFFDASLGSFHFLNYYTYSTIKPYYELHLEHNFTGYFLSHVPLLNKLNLQEIVGGSYLHQGTLPDYKEVYIGLKRTVIRLDYGLAYGRFTTVVQGFRLSYNL